MHFEPAWHAQGLRWIASLLESAAEALERAPGEPVPANDPDHCIEEVRLRAHLRGL